MSDSHDKPPPEDDQPPLQFSLRTLMLGVTLAAVVCGMLVILPGMWGWAILFAILLIAGHVAGNRLGTSLPDQADDEISAGRDLPSTAGPRSRAVTSPRPASAEPTGSWQRKTTLNRGYLVFAAVCAALGAVGGGVEISDAIGPAINLGGIAVASAASGVLGGFVGFLISTSLATFAGGVIEAQRHSQPDERRNS